MLRRRLLYAALLLGALVFQIFNTVYLAQFVLALVICLPFLSMAVSLPTMLRCRVWVEGKDAMRGEAVQFHIRVQVPSRLPVGRLRLRLRQENTMTGQVRVHKVTLNSAFDGMSVSLPAETAHCGRLRCGCRYVKVCDCLGLFTIRRPVLPAALLVLPRPVQAEPLPPPPDQQTSPAPCTRTGRRGEDYELRPYRPGDPLRQVHWKLSAKQPGGDLVVREMQEDRIPTVVLLFDRGGTPAALDRRLDRLDALCRSLLQRERIFYVTWRAYGEIVSRPVGNEHQLYTLLETLLELPVTAEPLPLPEPCRPVGLSGPIQYCHIAGEEDGPCAQNQGPGAAAVSEAAP